MQQHLGKIIGVLIAIFLKLGFLGILGGLIVGHLFDRRRSPNAYSYQDEDQQSRQEIFFTTTFQVMGHLSKAKGVVTERDIMVANAIMDRFDLEGEQRRIAQDAFTAGKSPDFPLRKVMREFRLSVGRRFDLLKIFLEIQLQVALSDGKLSKEEHDVLAVLANELGLSSNQFEHIMRMLLAGQNFSQQSSGYYQQQSGQQQYGNYSSGFGAPSREDQLAEAFGVLGIEPTEDSTVIKRAYKKLMSEHHPDKLVAKGLPPEMMEMAKTKTQAIQSAYELIKNHLGFK